MLRYVFVPKTWKGVGKKASYDNFLSDAEVFPAWHYGLASSSYSSKTIWKDAAGNVYLDYAECRFLEEPNIYPTRSFKLNKSTGIWEEFQVEGSGLFSSFEVWSDNEGNVYCNSEKYHSKFNGTAWELVDAPSVSFTLHGHYVWKTPDGRIYHSGGSTGYQGVYKNGKWESHTWDLSDDIKGPDNISFSLYKYGIWNDKNNNVYYSVGKRQYQLQGNTWKWKEWNITPSSCTHMFPDGNIYTVDYNSKELYVLDNGIWKPSDAIAPVDVFYNDYIWDDGSGNTYYSKYITRGQSVEYQLVDVSSANYAFYFEDKLNNTYALCRDITAPTAQYIRQQNELGPFVEINATDIINLKSGTAYEVPYDGYIYVALRNLNSSTYTVEYTAAGSDKTFIGSLSQLQGSSSVYSKMFSILPVFKGDRLNIKGASSVIAENIYARWYTSRDYTGR